MEENHEPRIAVLIPCHNEQVSICKVIDEFRHQLPSATIYAFDNCSTDASVSIAAEHGAVVIKEPRLGKGYVVASMFDRIHADFYVMVDGDDTYPTEYVQELLGPVMSGDADIVVGARLTEYAEKSFRPLHMFGNRLVRALINWIYNVELTDVMSGFRAFNRRTVTYLPVVSSGFEVETEMTIQALYYQLKIIEVAVPYRERPAGSISKLKTFRDGFRVLWKIFSLFRAFKPLTFFGGIGIFTLMLGLVAGILPVCDYITDPNHYVRHVPLAILATGLVVLSAMWIFLGILLHSLNWRFRELHSVITRKTLSN
jgi:glycosyltransferase involved in cell wall biosynthesis